MTPQGLLDAIYKALQKHQSVVEQVLTQARSRGDGQDKPVEPELLLPDRSTGLTQPSAADIARQQRADEAHQLHQQGWTNRMIATRIGVCPKTVGRYLNTELALTSLRRSRRRQLLDPYRPHIIERGIAGCHNAAQLCREIQAKGFSDQYSIVRHFVSELRKLSGLPPHRCRRS